jgi:hypothetical protein
VLVEQLGIDYILLDDLNEIADLSYGLGNAKVMIPNIDWLEDNKKIDLKTVEGLYDEILKWLSVESLMAPDIFGFIFWYITRYEEYLDSSRDSHGRYCAHQSLAYRKSCLERPIVDECVHKFRHILRSKLPHLIYKTQKVRHQSTIDIDQMWAYAHKGCKVFLGALRAKILGNQQEFLFRKKSFISAYDDPYFTFVDIEQWHTDANLDITYFVLSSDNKHPLDINHPIDVTPMRAILEGLQNENNIGLHPSIHAHTRVDVLDNEKQKLEKVLRRQVTKSRQHFLKFELPETYRRLILVGVHEDYSMGYADHIGYRAGTGHSYSWYDLENELSTSLRITPLIVMDVTLKKYMSLNPDNALKRVKDIISNANAINSPFTLLWHNSSLSALDDWTSWREVYRALLLSLSPSKREI